LSNKDSCDKTGIDFTLQKIQGIGGTLLFKETVECQSVFCSNISLNMNFLLFRVSMLNVCRLRLDEHYRGKDNVYLRTGHEGPEGE